MNVLCKTYRTLSTWKIFVGICRDKAPPRSIIFFPIIPGFLCCGFAGIMTITGDETPGEADPVTGITRLFKKAREINMGSVLAGRAAPVDYLGDEKPLPEMEKLLLELKRDSCFEEIFYNQETARHLYDLTGEMKAFLAVEEKCLEEHAGYFSTGDMEMINSRLIIIKDIIWSLEKDILDNTERIVQLAGAARANEISPASLKKYRKINSLLNCLDRLEVRGRDSTGIQISFTLRDRSVLIEITETLKHRGLYDDFLKRIRAGDLINGSIHLSSENPAGSEPAAEVTSLSFVYKTSSIIGELGQNVKDLRKCISQDRIFHEFSRIQSECETTIAHTRWASVGSITDENAHPINNFTLNKDIPGNDVTWPEVTKHYPFYGKGSWFISVLLNGDIDNYQMLRNNLESGEYLIAPDVTTDTKVIPLQVERYLLEGHNLTEAFRLAVNDFEGSHAIAMVSNTEPGKIFLSLRGSGQSIYVGLTPDQYLFSSELYGLVEGTPYFIKMDGEKPSSHDFPGTAGQIFILDQNSRGGVSGIQAFFYDSTPLLIDASCVQKAEITTRDIDRGNYSHYFLKEISESTLSVKKTLRGKYRIVKEENGKPSVIFNLGQDIVPEKFKHAFSEGRIRRIIIIGHGTAAVAGTAVADGFERYLKGSRIKIESRMGSELSGFFLEDDLRDALIIPITQSGTTTDTNRAVAMAVERGATAIAIVNRRQSDITTKANGVFYTSDGRDIEMSVASTKAFYSQIVAGHIFALYLAQLLKTAPDDFIMEELLNMEKIPHLMTRVIEKKEEIKQSVDLLAKKRKYWAVVGSGPNKAAADEIRIKLSELCYKTISSDIIENKKHIDLSAEPLIIVCAAGNPESVTGDVIKDVAIFKAHRAGVVVFADEGEERFNTIADAVIELPGAPMPLPVILNTLAGHLWGYYAACNINEDAAFLRGFRSQLDRKMSEHEKTHSSLFERIADRTFRRLVADFSAQFNRMRNDGAFSFTSANTMSDTVLLLKYATGKLPLEDFWRDFRTENDLTSPIELLDVAIGHMIDELSRPIDAIRHQAKTVTVGTSRKETPVQGIIFDLLRKLKFSLKDLVAKNIMVITRIQPAVSAIKGYTLYDINNLDADGNPVDVSTIRIRQKDGISQRMKSRAETSNVLMGTKKTIVSTGHIYVGRGKSDNASIVIIPLLGEGTFVRNLLLIHIDFNDTLSIREKKAVLGYQYNDIRNLINEYNLPWDDGYLEAIPTGVLLGEPPEVIAGHIKNLAETSKKFR